MIVAAAVSTAAVAQPANVTPVQTAAPVADVVGPAVPQVMPAGPGTPSRELAETIAAYAGADFTDAIADLIRTCLSTPLESQEIGPRE
jgi:hypothetical protein